MNFLNKQATSRTSQTWTKVWILLLHGDSTLASLQYNYGNFQPVFLCRMETVISTPETVNIYQACQNSYHNARSSSQLTISLVFLLFICSFWFCLVFI